MSYEVFTASVRTPVSPEVQMEAVKVKLFQVWGAFPLGLASEADGGRRPESPSAPESCSFSCRPHIHMLNGFLWQLGIFMAPFDSMGFAADGGWRCWWGGGVFRWK